MSKIVWLCDYPNEATSGYATISKPICNLLMERGHDVKLVGLSNRGEEHFEKFAIIPSENIQEAVAAIHNLSIVWKPDVIIMAIDIPHLLEIYSRLGENDIRKICITPMENGPLCMPWASGLIRFDKVFYISQLAVDASRTAGVEAEHLVVGIDHELWKPAESEEQRSLIRKKLGFEENEKVILTVADNQERKNLWANLSVVCQMVYGITNSAVLDVYEGKKELPKKVRDDLRIVFVTRPKNYGGYSIQDIAYKLGISSEVVVFERGMKASQLRLLYIASDCFLLLSKGEGLGLPVLEAMACGLVPVCTDTGALHEILQEGRGVLVPVEYSLIDVWGDSRRDFPNLNFAAIAVGEVIAERQFIEDNSYILSRTLENMTDQVENAILNIEDSYEN